MSAVILIVNDDAVARTIVIGALMQHLGDAVEYLQAESAEDGFVEFWAAESRGAPVNVLVLDLNLPGREGLWMLDTLRADPTLKSRFDTGVLSVLVYSSEDEGARKTAMTRGADAAFHNQTELEHLVTAVVKRVSSDHWHIGG